MAWEKHKLTLNKEHYIFLCLQFPILLVDRHRVVSTVLLLQVLDLQSPVMEYGTPALLLVHKVPGTVTFELNQPLPASRPRCLIEAPRSSDAEESCLIHCLVNPAGAGAC